MLVNKLPKIQAGLHHGRGLNFWFEDLSCSSQVGKVLWDGRAGGPPKSTVQKCPLETPCDRQVTHFCCRILQSCSPQRAGERQGLQERWCWYKDFMERNLRLSVNQNFCLTSRKSGLAFKSSCILNPTGQGMAGVGWSQGRSLAESSKQTAVWAQSGGLCFYSYQWRKQYLCSDRV